MSYTSKAELLAWASHVLQIKISRLEEFTNGALYAQLVDAYHPNSVAIHRVNFQARDDREILANYKLLQTSFTALEIDNNADVAKLSRGIVSDNLEMLQWMYKHLQRGGRVPHDGYDPGARRAQSMRGAVREVPLPNCLANSTGHKLGSSRTNSGGSSKGASSRGMIDLSHVTSRWREGLAPPTESQPNSQRALTGKVQLKSAVLALAAGDVSPDNKSSRTSSIRTPRTSIPGMATQTDNLEDFSQRLCITPTSKSTGKTPSPRVSLSSSQRRRVNPSPSQTSPAATTPQTKATPSRPLPNTNVPESGFSAAWSGGTPQAQASEGGTSQASSPNPPGGVTSSVPSHQTPPGGASAAPSPGPIGGAAHSVSHTKGDVDNNVQQGKADLPPSLSHSNPHPGAGNNISTTSTTTATSTNNNVNITSTTNNINSANNSTNTNNANTNEALPDLLANTTNTTNTKGAFPDLLANTNNTNNSNRALPDLLTNTTNTTNTNEALPDLLANTNNTKGALADLLANTNNNGVVSGHADLPPMLLVNTGDMQPTDNGANAATKHSSLQPADSQSLPSPSQCVGGAKAGHGALLVQKQEAEHRGGRKSHLIVFSRAVEASTSAVSCLQASVDGMQALLATSWVGSTHAKGAMAKGKTRSVQDAAQTLLHHTRILVDDVKLLCRKSVEADLGPLTPPEARDMELKASELATTLGQLKATFSQSVNRGLNDLLGHVAPITDAGAVDKNSAEGMDSNIEATLTSTHLDAAIKSVGVAHFALDQLAHRGSAARHTAFFKAEAALAAGLQERASSNSDGTGEPARTSTSGRSGRSRAFKMGEFQLKQLRNGDVYKGRYTHGKKNGDGVYQFVNMDVYEGEFGEDRMDGMGVYTFSHEGRYEGQWHGAVYSGHGGETFAKGSTYHGQYLNGLRDGWGVCRFYNGDYYEGQWRKGLRDGVGMQQCTDDSNFVGDYKSGKRHGFGLYSFPNGDRYVGEYLNDLPHGHGVYAFGSGQRYEGEWLHGKKHGWSIYTVGDSQFVGKWNDSQPQWVQPLRPLHELESSRDESSPYPALRNSSSLNPNSEAGEEAAVRGMHMLACKAQAKSREVAQLALSRAGDHWSSSSNTQKSILTAVQSALQSCEAAQVARWRAVQLSVTLDVASAQKHKPPN